MPLCGATDLSLINKGVAVRGATDTKPSHRTELLRQFLYSQVRSLSKINIVSKRNFIEMLARPIRFYNQRSLFVTGVITKIEGMAQQLNLEYDRGTKRVSMATSWPSKMR
ncbi:type I restriction enzyme endonuclease domain-containing protein [Ferrimicrobium sp.]|uniref:type I restriction enzyme endonuclease domain-containing protein n=1 Tax=Ferrimicrobium sp. TaxID=2926050 RepID=UPI002623406A|nr:type I restriction enzyme endonuclease domain-containing protein [Ferrimicrobium sp.]